MFYLIITLIVSTLVSFTVRAEYPSQLQIEFKHGNHRILGRGNMLISLWQQPHRLLFAHMVGLLDKDHNQESNLGVGYRHQKRDYILGAYGYYDHRRSTHHHHFHQVTLGLEYLTSHFEARLNGYWPFHTKHSLTTQGVGLSKFIGAHYQLAKLNHQVGEYALGGFDIETGIKLPKSPLHMYGGYYYFKRQGLARLHGPRIRTQMPIASMLFLNVECHYDRFRGLNYFLGLELTANLGAKCSPSGLARKMLQFPIRDIDIIIQAGEQIIEIDTQTAIPIESYIDLDKVRENLNGYYIVTKDIMAVGQQHIPIGNEKAPFTGVIVGVSDDKSQLQLREIRGLILNTKQKDTGLFGYINRACIGYLSINHQPLRLMHFTPNTTIGSLVGRAKSYNILIHNRNLTNLSVMKSFIGGLVGYAIIHNKFIHNSNYGTLIAEGPNNHIGGIVGSSYADNIWTHNLNVGTIILHTIELSASSIVNYAGGIVSSTGIGNLLTYNINAGKIQGAGAIKGNGIGGIIGYIGSENICTHNINTAPLNGNQVGGIASKAGRKNTFSYNFNTGALVENHSESTIGGILGSVEEDNIISYNANSGNIAGEASTVGGIVMHVRKDNIVSYNMNIGEISVYKKDFFSTIGGIVAEISEYNTVSYNINAGVILVDSHSEAEPDPDYPELERSVRIGGIVALLSGTSIPYGGYAKLPTHNTITHNIQAGVITVNDERYAENYIGGVIGEHRNFSANHFVHNLYSSALISHSPTMEQQLQSDPKTHLDSDNSFIDVTDLSTLPKGYFGLTQDWLLTARGPVLTWLWKNRTLQLLQYFNYLKVIHADDYLPMEILLAIAGALDDFSYLSFAQMQRIYRYVFTPVHGLVDYSGTLKYYWSKDDYLAYVLQ